MFACIYLGVTPPLFWCKLCPYFEGITIQQGSLVCMFKFELAVLLMSVFFNTESNQITWNYEIYLSKKILTAHWNLLNWYMTFPYMMIYTKSLIAKWCLIDLILYLSRSLPLMTLEITWPFGLSMFQQINQRHALPTS